MTISKPPNEDGSEQLSPKERTLAAIEIANRRALVEYLNNHDPAVEAVFSALARLGHEPVARAALALARVAMAEFEAHPNERVPSVLKNMAREMVFRAEQRIGGLDEPFDEEATNLVFTGAEEPDALALQDGLIDHCRWLSICLHALVISGPVWDSSVEGLIYDASHVWRNHPRIIGMIKAELLPWAMGNRDPLKLQPTTRHPS